MPLLDSAQRERIVSAIREAEKDTSGEIRVHVQRHARGDIQTLARSRFEALGLTKTQHRNGVLVFVAVEDRQFCVLGDKGIHVKVGQDFWHATVEIMTRHFREGDFTGGVEAGVRHIGKTLREQFPHKRDDVNEVSDDVSMGS